MASWVQIANLALRRLGADRISVLDEDSEQARAVNDVYLTVLDYVLRLHPWNCALVRTNLAADATAPDWGYAYRFQLPSDPYCLRLWRIGSSGTGSRNGGSNNTMSHRILGRFIHCDEAGPLYIEYISRLTDPEQFDVVLTVAMAAHIAEEIAFRLTGKRSDEERMQKWAEQTLARAKSADAQEGTPEDIEADYLIGERDGAAE